MNDSRKGRAGRCSAVGRDPVCAGHITAETARKLRELAERYETADFSNGDPSCVLKRYTAVADVECAAFIAAVLAFGRRDQFLPKIASIFEEADRHGGPEKWLKSGSYASFGAQTASAAGGACAGEHSGADLRKTSAPATLTGSDKRCAANAKFYRFYSYSDMTALFARLHDILERHGTLGNCVKTLYERTTAECAAASFVR